LESITTGLFWVECGGNSYERFTGLPTELLSEKLDDGLEAVDGVDLVEILLHDGGVADSLEADDDWWRGEGGEGEATGELQTFGGVFFAVRLEGLDRLHGAVVVARLGRGHGRC
jgi:hypothetical protein